MELRINRVQINRARPVHVVNHMQLSQAAGEVENKMCVLHREAVELYINVPSVEFSSEAMSSPKIIT